MKRFLPPKSLLFLAFILPLTYWLYLLFNSKMAIECDAIGYENLGRILYQNGWIEYFRQGPNREPFYSLTIALAMALANLFSANYQFLQAILQILIMILTQFLTLQILKKLQIHQILSAVTLLYLGFSPAIVNSAFSLYSEILTYPFVLLLILLLAEIWTNLYIQKTVKILWLGMLTGFCGLFLVYIKGIFEIVFPLILIGFLAMVILNAASRDRKLTSNCIIFFAAGMLIFNVPIFLHKTMNKKYNGNFTFTDRGPWALYGNTARRSEPMSAGRVLAAAAYVLGDGACKRLCDKDDCYYWSFWTSDRMAQEGIARLAREGYGNRMSKQLVLESARLALKNLPQYTLFAALESAKMFFWESTKIGFVSYPPGLSRLFDWGPFKDGIRILLALLSLLAFFFTGVTLWQKRRMLRGRSPQQEKLIIVTLIFLFISFFAGIHAVFYVLPRYALPIAPLLLILIAFALQKIFQRDS